jgi:hypothetical protein
MSPFRALLLICAYKTHQGVCARASGAHKIYTSDPRNDKKYDCALIPVRVSAANARAAEILRIFRAAGALALWIHNKCIIAVPDRRYFPLTAV